MITIKATVDGEQSGIRQTKRNEELNIDWIVRITATKYQSLAEILLPIGISFVFHLFSS